MADPIDRNDLFEAMSKYHKKAMAGFDWVRFNEVMQSIVDLPSAQPDLPDTNVGDMISRQAAIDSIMEEPSEARYPVFYAEKIRQLTPAHTERKRGKWEVCDILDYAQRHSGRKILRCPFCKYMTDDFRSIVDYYHKLTNFCPNCGAVMRGRNEDGQNNREAEAKDRIQRMQELYPSD